MPIIRDYTTLSKKALPTLTPDALLAEFENTLQTMSTFRYSAQVANDPEWMLCPISNIRFPKKYGIPANYQGKKIIVSKSMEHKNNSFVDCKGVRHLLAVDTPCEVYSNDGKTKVYSSWEVNNGLVKSYQARITRGTTQIVDFEHGFRDHSAGHNKAFDKPRGEAIGIEIEVAFKPTADGNTWINKLNFSAWMLKNYPDWICERDGSLEGPGNRVASGLEIISPPLPTAKIKDDLKLILEKCSEFGGVGYKAMTDEIPYGIHVTQNLYGEFSINDGDRYTYFFNSMGMRQFFATASRRANHREFIKYSGFQNIAAVKGAMRSQREGHYRSVFPRGDGAALETRIFRSNINYHAVCGIIDLCIWTMNYCKDTKNNLDNPQDYVKFLKEKAPKSLIKYINSWKGFQSLNNDEGAYID